MNGNLEDGKENRRQNDHQSTKRWVQSKSPPRTYQGGDLVWLEGCNLHLDQPATKLSPK